MHRCSFSTSNKITSKGCHCASQTCDFDAKNFCGEAQPPPPVGRGTPPPHTPRLFRHLDLNPLHSEILPTLLEPQLDVAHQSQSITLPQF